jgi:hypothetical protein
MIVLLVCLSFRAACQGLIAIEVPKGEFLLFSLQHWAADGDIDY